MKKCVPKVIGVRKKPTSQTPKHQKKSARRISYEYREKTKRERVYKVIEDACCRGYRFTDNYYGLPFIELKDLEEKEDGIYVIRFRCEPQYLQHVYFGRMAEDVCKTLRSGIHFFHEFKTEWGLPYEECIWVLQIGEQDIELPLWRKLFMAETVIKELSPEDNPHPRKCTHVRWEEFLQAHYSRSLLSVAQELGYSEQNLDILGCDFTNPQEKKRIYKKHKKLFDDFLADERNNGLMDGRKVYEYFKDLIAGWVGEDLLVKALNEYGFKASVANADSDRIIKTNYVGVTGDPDIKIEYEGNTRYLELMVALSPIEKYGQFDIRLSKAKNQYNKKTLFLLHGLADSKFVLIDFMRDNVTVTSNYPNPRYGNKPSSIVKFEDNNIRMQDMVLLWESIKDIMQNTNPEPQHCLKMVDFMTGSIEVLGHENDGGNLSADDSEDSEASFAEEPEPSDDTAESNEMETPPDTEPIAEEVAEAENTEQPQAEDVTHGVESTESTLQNETDEEGDNENGEPILEEDDESSIVEEDDNGEVIEYTPEQWAALNEVF